MKHTESLKFVGIRADASQKQNTHTINNQQSVVGNRQSAMSETHIELDQDETEKRAERLTRREDVTETQQQGEGNENERRTRGTAALHAINRKTSKSKTNTRHSCECAKNQVTKEMTPTVEHQHTSQSTFLHQAVLHPSQLSKHSGRHGNLSKRWRI